MATTDVSSPKRKWRLSRAALYGFFLQLFVAIVGLLNASLSGGTHPIIEYLTVMPWPVGLAGLISFMSAGPLIFVVVAFIRNLFVRNTVEPDPVPASMLTRLGQVFYWAGSLIALLLLGVAAYGALAGRGDERWLAIGIAASAAVVVWMLGRAILYVLAGK